MEARGSDIKKSAPAAPPLSAAVVYASLDAAGVLPSVIAAAGRTASEDGWSAVDCEGRTPGGSEVEEEVEEGAARTLLGLPPEFLAIVLSHCSAQAICRWEAASRACLQLSRRLRTDGLSERSLSRFQKSC